MSDAPSSHAARLLQRLLLIAVVVLVVSCRHSRYLTDGVPKFDPGPCRAHGSDPAPNPSPNPDAPIVCVDDRDLSHVQVWPDWVHAKHGAAINWFTVTGEGSLAIVFTDASPVKTLLCGPNKAFCHAVIDKDAPSKPYRYGVRVVRAGKKGDVDPTVDVDPGMTAIVPPSFTTQ